LIGEIVYLGWLEFVQANYVLDSSV
jgi:hypothetical protein